MGEEFADAVSGTCPGPSSGTHGRTDHPGSEQHASLPVEAMYAVGEIRAACAANLAPGHAGKIPLRRHLRRIRKCAIHKGRDYTSRRKRVRVLMRNHRQPLHAFWIEQSAHYNLGHRARSILRAEKISRGRDKALGIGITIFSRSQLSPKFRRNIEFRGTQRQQCQSQSLFLAFGRPDA